MLRFAIDYSDFLLLVLQRYNRLGMSSLFVGDTQIASSTTKRHAIFMAMSSCVSSFAAYGMVICATFFEDLHL